VDLDKPTELLACDQPHPAELLATGWVSDRSVVTTPEITTSCEDIAGRIMRTGDPTRGRALTITLEPVTKDGATVPNAPLSVSCFVSSAGSAQLLGTLIGIGDQPLPLG
jgi:hypothetical protein